MTTYEQIGELTKKVDRLTEAILPDESNEFQADDKKFSKRRMWFVVIGLMSSALYTYVFFLFFLPLFSISFGFFLAFAMLAFLLLFDEYILPGNTIKRISNNAIGSAIAIFAFAVVIISGAQIGNSLISEPYRGEEYRQPSRAIRLEQLPTPSPAGSEMLRNDRKSESEQ